MKYGKIKQTPLTAFICVFILTIFLLYVTNVLKEVPCDKDMKSIFISNFIHTDFFHIAANLYGLYSLSRVELSLGPKKFFILLIFLLIFGTIFESVIHKLIKTPCSIGFSGLLYGIMTFEIMYNKKFDYNIFTSIILNIIVSKLGNRQVSLTGHIVGAISGIIGGLIFNKLTRI